MRSLDILYLKIQFLFLIFCLTLISINSFPEEVTSLKLLSSKELIEKAQENYQKGNYYYTIQFLTEYVERNPQEIQALIFLAKNYISIQKCDKAFEILNRIENQYTEIKLIEILKNFCYLERGQIQSVRNNISKLEKDLVDEPDFWLLKGDYYLKLNYYDLTEMFYNKYLYKFPNQYRIYIKMISLYLNKNDFENAYIMIEDFKKKFPDNIEYFRLLGDYFYRLGMNQKTNQKENFQKSYKHYKTYLNYVSFNPEIYEVLLFLAYDLQDKEKLNHLLSEYNFVPKNTLLVSNINSILGDTKLLESLESLCKENKVLFSCTRYDFLLMNSNSPKKTKRIKQLRETLATYKKNLQPYFPLLIWLNSLEKDSEFILNEFLNYYKNTYLYEDYYLILLKLFKKTSDPKFSLLAEKFSKEKNQYQPFLIFSHYPLDLVKNAYKRTKKRILILNPLPLEQKENHFKESNLIRDYINLFVNQIPYFEALSNSDFDDIKIRALNSSQQYLFYHPELTEIISEWELEKNTNVDYILESNYRMKDQFFYITLILRDSNGMILKKQDFLYGTNSEFQFILDVENFLLNVNLEGRYLQTFNNKVLINLGKVDKVKKDQIFRFKGTYYKVDNVFSYSSLLTLIKGKPQTYTEEDIFVRVSNPL